MNGPRCLWPHPHEPPRLAPGEVHVWCLPLDLNPPQVEALSTALSPDEVARAARFHFDSHRRRFIACRGQLRTVLAGYAGVPAAEIAFRYGAVGKPALAAPRGATAISFNVSNSHEMGVCAVTLDRAVGVDVERLRPPRDFNGLAAHFFAREEVDVLRSLPPARQLEAFFNCWTRKEAVLKATGTGLAVALDRVVVTLSPDDPARVLAFDGDPAAGARWWIEGIVPAPEYVGAVTSHGPPLRVQRWLSIGGPD